VAPCSLVCEEAYHCKICGFHGGDYDDYHLLGDDNHQAYHCSEARSSSILRVDEQAKQAINHREASERCQILIRPDFLYLILFLYIIIIIIIIIINIDILENF
jgi:hypothetical protein